MDNILFIDTLFPRADPIKCPVGGVGDGDCIPAADCRGLQILNECPSGLECCLKMTCKVPEGNGVCLNSRNQTQACNGKFFQGEQKPNGDWPCHGGDDVQCCVKYEAMNNGTTTSSSTSSMPATGSALPASSSKNKLNGGQIAGIVVGVVAGAVILGLLAFFFYWRKHHQNRPTVGGPDPQAREIKPSSDETALTGGHRLGELEGQDKIYEMGGRDVDGKARALELPGSSQPVVELPASSPEMRG